MKTSSIFTIILAVLSLLLINDPHKILLVIKFLNDMGCNPPIINIDFIQLLLIVLFGVFL